MKNKIKVSFDFDATLSREDVQEYASECIEKGYEVWITTSRSPEDESGYLVDGMKMKSMNDDLYKVAEELGIKKENIIFTKYKNKSDFINNKGFAFHIDDDNIELSFIDTDTDVLPIFLFSNKNWRRDCSIAINQFKNKNKKTCM